MLHVTSQLVKLQLVDARGVVFELCAIALKRNLWGLVWFLREKGLESDANVANGGFKFILSKVSLFTAFFGQMIYSLNSIII